MSVPTNIFSNILSMEAVISSTFLYEKRMDYDESNNLIYIGFNVTPDADPDDATWYVLKFEYTGNNTVRARLPNGGPLFIYSWTDRATYFA